MRKDRLYFLTFLSITIIFLIIASFTVGYFIKVSASQLIEVQVESSKREVNEIATLINAQLESGLSKESIVDNLQRTIEKTNSDSWFISMIDWSGKEVCHPNRTEIGQKTNSNQTLLASLNENNNSDALYDVLVNNSSEASSEIIYISPIRNADWIVAAHANIPRISGQMKDLKNNFYIIFSLMGVLVILLSFLAVRLIGSKYEKQLELKNTTLESEVLNLSKLNVDLVTYKERVVESTKEEEQESISDTSKTRILTYIRNELVPVRIQDIAYVYTENTITYVVCFDGKKSTSNVSLDDMFTNLDSSLFFRANRQFIIGITAIDKIIRYGNSQLKILVQSNTSVEIIISKNKAAEFKQWLNS
ncbi:LytTR family transcriptional regulator DNA-binding domain-containing protein [Flavobacteriaceae bacterium S356]|uniref:LytTR family transcriptional regulator DNA-binding domain-containing protein n=1 Tax=Asprobacillus argus TaxID=3076534 RepID=A0ABU3LH57_9FLAO|nr:LytTR family transcriptional regulator DNA-binding domain-containing protein [Flavobacteriaceae bacterium S356]